MHRQIGRLGALAVVLAAVALGAHARPAAGQSAGGMLTISQTPAAVGQTGVATARFNRTFNCGSAATPIVCIDPTTGLPIVVNQGSVLNGNVVFTIENPEIAAWVAAQPTATSPAPSSTGGFTATANQVIVRCGPFATTGFPITSSGGIGSSPFASFFGGCESASATYQALRPGFTNISATFIPDLPGAFGQASLGIAANVAPLLGQFRGPNPTDTKVLEVIGAAPSGNVALGRGCNNVSPTVTEAAATYAGRVGPAGALVSIFEYQAATNTFRGFSPQPGAPNDLATITRLRPVFLCLNATATLNQPAA